MATRDLTVDVSANLKELEKVSDKLQLTAHKLDHVRELVLQHDRERWQTKIKQLKQGDGEDWAIGETIQRILDIDDCENNRY